MNTRISKSMVAIACFSAIGFFPEAMRAQTGRLSGQVLDATQALVPGASITLDNPANGDHRKVLTDNAGRYTFPDVPIGLYSVRAEKTGFQTQVRQGVDINIG